MKCRRNTNQVRYVLWVNSSGTKFDLHFDPLFFSLDIVIPDKQKRTAEIIKRLQKAYPDAHCALNHTNPFELLVATILSAQCTDERVNIVTATLFRKYRGPQDFVNVSQEELDRKSVV